MLAPFIFKNKKKKTIKYEFHKVEEKIYKFSKQQFWWWQEFTSEEVLIKKVKRYESRYNNISKKVLGFKSPNEMVKQYSI
ncbi:MAG: hypothetical protein PHS98_03355 [Bacilli bacterium]|nr:hypothetical protein [Bacilli bacterium]